MDADAGHERIAAGALVAAAGRELAKLAALVEGLQALVARHVGLDPDAIEEAQGLDLLQQHLTALAELLEELGGDAALSADVAADPLRLGVPLADLAARLFGDDDAKPFARPTAGAVELF